LLQEVSSKFRVPKCEQCGSGILKPNVVFYGENVPLARKETVKEALEHSDAVLVLGTTLHTRSSRDHVEYAHKIGLPIALVNIGFSYGDTLAKVRLNARCGEIMKLLVEEGAMPKLQ
jgi:NAD-dependent SIR2 family protein deacetylase